MMGKIPIIIGVRCWVGNGPFPPSRPLSSTGDCGYTGWPFLTTVFLFCSCWTMTGSGHWHLLVFGYWLPLPAPSPSVFLVTDTPVWYRSFSFITFLNTIICFHYYYPFIYYYIFSTLLYTLLSVTFIAPDWDYIYLRKFMSLSFDQAFSF